MKMAKWSMVLISSMMLASALSACGNSNNETPAPSNETSGTNTSATEPETKTEAVTLKFWSALDPSSDQGKTIQQKVKEFDDSHDNINVDLQVISYDVLHDKLVAAINAGDAPDISWGLGEWFGEFNKLDALADLTDSFNAWPEKDKIYPNVLEAMQVDGKLKALPNYLGIRALLYHEDLLKQGGLTEPPKTWDELLNAAQAFKDKTGKEIFGIAGAGVRSPQELIMYLAQNDVALAEKQADGKFKNTWQDNPDQLAKAAEVFQFYQDLVAKNAVKADARTWGWEEEDQNFVLGQYAMVVNGTWIEGRASENPEGMKDVKVAPPIYGSKPATFMEIAPLFIYKSKHPEETFEFATFLMGADYQKAVNPSSAPRTDVVSEGWGKEFMALAEQGIAYPAVSLGGITKAMEDSLALALLKKEKPEDVAKKLADAINDSLKKNGELSGS
ncbi:ABC-type glycerol-3-phosphate transport system substrate-binding protein [Paenibacillus phyllosphaerae]|uniref:ABC-type glycerol-3-phosphate transport system substrate-binding protein n=1 Tax=Paenibacillus phyllosphaerae TaxID=274593 RepID=A0A7W5B523_9BACL|nr:sugar ABC transporter substrate-binding protein [Paenibacillus phyllosphaerae]MBB3114503.1 ABC-type glycerol-3-phosphate transport system substrate-binding protein [Paenibacillus phyllosphaerae]